MVSLNVSKHIEAPPEVVFQRVSDFEGSADVINAIESVEMLTEGKVGVGTRFRETRIMMKRPCTEEMEVTEFEEGKRYVLHAENHGCVYRSEIRVEPSGTGTELTMEFQATPQTFMGKVFGLLTRPLTRKMVQLCAKDFDDVKAAIEAGSSRAEAQ